VVSRASQATVVVLLVIIVVALLLGLQIRRGRTNGATTTAVPDSTTTDSTVSLSSFTASTSKTPASSSTQPLPQDYTGTLESGGLQRSYIVHLPTGYTSSPGPWPLVLVLHGGLGNGSGMNSLTGFNALADNDGFIVVYPVGVQEHWADGRGTTPPDKEGVDDVAFISSLIDELTTRLHVDPKKVYASGISDGGFMTMRLGCQLADKIAAIAVVAATMPTNDANTCDPGRPVPVVLFHGSADSLVPAIGGNMTAGTGGEIQSVNATMQLWATIEGCSTIPAVAYLPVLVNDGTTVVEYAYGGCRQGASAIFYDIIGGGHTWPGGEQYLPAAVIGRTSHNIDASSVSWEFFKSHPMP
jgi:polyhydroxybutyrate depolymerase